MDPIVVNDLATAFVGMTPQLVDMAWAMSFLTLFGGAFLALLFPVYDNMDNIAYKLFFEDNSTEYNNNVLKGLAEYEQLIVDKQKTDIEKASKALKLNKHRARVRAWIKTPVKAQAVKLERIWAPKPKNVRQRMQRRLLVDEVPTFEYLVQNNGFRNQGTRNIVIGFRSRIAKAKLASAMDLPDENKMAYYQEPEGYAEAFVPDGDSFTIPCFG